MVCSWCLGHLNSGNWDTESLETDIRRLLNWGRGRLGMGLNLFTFTPFSAAILKPHLQITECSMCNDLSCMYYNDSCTSCVHAFYSTNTATTSWNEHAAVLTASPF